MTAGWIGSSTGRDDRRYLFGCCFKKKQDQAGKKKSSDQDKNKQKSSEGPIVTDNTAAEFHCTIISIGPSPVDPNVIWAGTDDGNVQVTRDGGKTWTNTVKAMTGLAPNAWVNKVEASHFDAGTAYVSASHWQDGGYAPYFYKTSDFGRTWTKFTGGLPARGWSHVIREDPKVRGLLYAGTEFGVYASWTDGAAWTSIRNNMPPVAVRDIAITSAWPMPSSRENISFPHGTLEPSLHSISPTLK